MQVKNYAIRAYYLEWFTTQRRKSEVMLITGIGIHSGSGHLVVSYIKA